MTMPALQLYDTSQRTKRVFEPLDPAHVQMYACGPTVYDRIHIGNARSFLAFDMLYRVLRTLYPKVTYVRNITDVDDKINARAAERGIGIADLTAETEQVFHADMAALGALEPDVEPRATAHIPQMLALIETLIDKRHAYAKDGHVLFDVGSMSDYGKLSRLDRDAVVAGARVDVAPYKKDPADFVLWKPSTGTEPGWDSPWGYGRPGWHLECSAMSSEYLGDEFDIHGGGVDLVFPHHENEIAQSHCAGHAFARYWVHNGYVMSEGEKMSKSLGNFYLVHELLDEFPGEALRLAMLKTHYRQPLDFTKAGVAAAKADLDSFYATLHSCRGIDASDTAPTEILAALTDDLNTPLALSRLHELRGNLNGATEAEAAAIKGKLVAGAALLGLLNDDPDVWRQGSAGVGPDDGEVQTLIERRIAARASKNFAEADQIRDSLAAQGIVLEDRPDGSTDWRRGD